MVLSDKIYALMAAEADEKYKAFSAKLTPGIDAETVIGVRFPVLKNIYSQMSDEERSQFTKELPHKYFEQNNLHAIIISHIKDEDVCLASIEDFLPYIDNWATCDTVSPSVFKKHKEKLLEKIKEWIKSDRIYTVRLGVGMLMKYFLGEDFKPEYNDMAAGIKSDEYYINMMCAWYFATALAKQFDSTVPYLKNHMLTSAVHKMTVRKACESYRITQENKEYLKKM